MFKASLLFFGQYDKTVGSGEKNRERRIDRSIDSAYEKVALVMKTGKSTYAQIVLNWGTVNVKAGEKKLVRIEKSDDYR